MLQIINAGKKFKKKTALDNININFENGVYGLLGPNGAGKTTLMRCICGLYSLNIGKIVFNDSDIKQNKMSKNIGYLPQKFGLFKELTIYEMMEYFATLKNITNEDQKKDIESCIERVNLLDRIHDRISTLSGGMIRRIGIAQAILGNPELAIFDEPTAGLDPEERMRFKNIISQIKKDKIIIISTHVVEDVEETCSDIMIMNEGKLVITGNNSFINNLAEGKVFLVDAENEKQLIGDFFIEKRTTYDNKSVLRVLSGEKQNGKNVDPTIEDGYICILKGF